MHAADRVTVFARLEPDYHASDALALPHWREEQWGKLLAYATPRHFRAGEVVIAQCRQR